MTRGPDFMVISSITAGILLMVTAMAFSAGIDGLVKHLGGTYPIVQVTFFRFLSGTLILLPFVMHRGIAATLRTRRPGLHFVRCALTFIAIFGAFTALSLLPLAENGTLYFTTPLIVTLLARPLLGEPVGRRRMMAVIVGFLGVLVMLRPGGAVVSPGAAVALGAAVFGALATLVVRALGRTESTLTSVAYFTLFGLAASAAMVPWGWVWPDLGDLALFAGLGLLTTSAQMLFTQALRLAPASTLAPATYTLLLFDGAVGYAVFDAVPAPETLLGAPLIVGAGLVVALTHRRT
ncbi:MAG: DMT family transporter [Alphaproteobacteria bacterium]